MFFPTRVGHFDLSQAPVLMGILNVTPDSFADGGRFNTVETALARAEEMARDGAAVIDVGGESTRPGADPVPLDVELKRVIPVIQTLASRLPSVSLSVDTTKAEVARQALEEGASLVNDVSALKDPWMPIVLREHDAPVVLMHRKGDPRTMQDNPVYGDVVLDIIEFFRERLSFAQAKGIPLHRIVLDPGIGFGKTTAHNIQILKRLPELAALGRPLLIGLSRKSFIGRILGGERTPLSPEERAEGSLAANLWAAAHGAHILRVHDIKALSRALALWRALEGTELVE
ncbi:MAG: dihydropteroate synthase [Elusimicrobia bacterium]|nr:dihydropteroate synthase [Elusimicrobiota bacterium]